MEIACMHDYIKQDTITYMHLLYFYIEKQTKYFKAVWRRTRYKPGPVNKSKGLNYAGDTMYHIQNQKPFKQHHDKKTVDFRFIKVQK